MNLSDHFKYRPFKPKKVLLVDDERDLGWIIEKIIREAGHTFIFASTFEEGIEKFRKSRNLDIAIVDLRIENGNGLTFIRNTKTIRPKIKFVMISAYGTPEVKEKARQLGVHHFLDKPLRLERLLDIINQC